MLFLVSRFAYNLVALLCRVFCTQQAVRCFLRFRLWVASSKVPKLRSAKRTFSAPWLELKSRIAPRLTWLWVRSVYVPHDIRHKYHTTWQLCWKKALHVSAKQHFVSEKHAKKCSKSSKNNSKTQKTTIFDKFVTFLLCARMKLPRGALPRVRPNTCEIACK